MRESGRVCHLSLSQTFLTMYLQIPVGLELLEVGDTRSSISTAIWLSCFCLPPFTSEPSHSRFPVQQQQPAGLTLLSSSREFSHCSKQVLQPSLLSPTSLPSPFHQIAIFVHRKTNSALPVSASSCSSLFLP
jgi:hypothetical protein